MAKSEIAKIDGKGRLQIPSSYRSTLRIKGNSELLINLDEENQRIIISPTSEKSLLLIKISMSDAPGSLARMAKVLADEGVDLVSTESRSTARGKAAEWQVICDAHSVKDLNLLKKHLISAGARSVSMKRL